jgi:hypothetical protein
MKKLIIPIALLAMAALIGVAMVVDCVSLANSARERVELADQELAKNEQRLVKTLSGFVVERSPEVDSAIKDYESAKDLTARHEAYEKLVASFQRTMSSEFDPTNPTNRKFMDDVAGAINRRQIAEKAFDTEWQAYQEFLKTRRGKVASTFSSQESNAH